MVSLAVDFSRRIDSHRLSVALAFNTGGQIHFRRTQQLKKKIYIFQIDKKLFLLEVES